MFGKIILLAGIGILVWGAFARASTANGPPVRYHVHAYDTLWTVASTHYAGDVRAAIWKIQHANHLTGTTIHPGETLILP